MIEAVKDITKVIRDNKPTDIHPDHYHAVMAVVEFSHEALMVAHDHLFNHKASGTKSFGMAGPHTINTTNSDLGVMGW
jgi:hypothetical protein